MTPKLARGLPLVVFLVGLATAVAAFWHREQTNTSLLQARFDAAAARAEHQLRERLRLYEYGLRGARGAVIAAGGTGITRERFRAYSRSRDIASEFPGSLGYGFIRRVPRAEEESFLAAARHDDWPTFSLRELAPHTGERFVIQYIEPWLQNAVAIGLDIASEPNRREAAVRAMQTGEATLTAPITLVQLHGAHALGFLLLLPVYASDATLHSTAEREKATIGWAYAPLAISEVLRDFDYQNHELALAIRDVTGAPVNVFTSPRGDAAAAAGLVHVYPLHLFGRNFDVEIAARSAFVDRRELQSPLGVAVTTLVLTALLSALSSIGLKSVLRRRENAAALRASERRFRDLAESLPHLVWTCSSDGACDYLSPQWLSYTGTTEESQLGFGWLSAVHPDDVAATQREWQHAVETQSRFDTEFRIRRHDGVYRWFNARALPIIDGAGTVSKWFGSNTDIQDVRDAREAAQRANQELESRVALRTEELRRAHMELQSTAKQLHIAQRLTRVGSWELDVASGQVVWSEELYRILGVDPEGPPIPYNEQHVLYVGDSWQRSSAAVVHSIATGQGYELSLVARRASDGARIDAIARAEVIYDELGTVKRLVGTLQDVTEREHVRAQLEQISERLQLAMSAARMAVWDLSLEDGSLHWDDTMHALYGTHPKGATSTYDDWRNALHPEDRDATETVLRRALEAESHVEVQFRIVRPDGSVRYLRAAASIHRNAVNGQAVRAVGVQWDITEQRLAQLALESSEALQRGMLANAGLSIIATDTQGTITLFNPAAEALLGYRSEELIGNTTPLILHDPQEIAARKRTLEAELGCALHDPGEVFVARPRLGTADAHEWTYIKKNGERVPVLLTVSALRDSAGAIFGFLGVAADLTVQKNQARQLLALNELLAERSEQAESANRAKSMFLANMSHEIRTPLSAITGVTYLLSRTALAEEQAELLRTIERSTKTLLAMINDVLDLSKIEARQLSIEVAPFSVAALLDELAGMMRGYATGSDLELIIDADIGPSAELVGDRLRLTQVLTNLLGNAIKLTERGTVGLRMSRLGETAERVTVCFEVFDTGPGVEAELLPRLFSPFVQAETARTRRSGTGLGLAIVKELVTLMGGEVGVQTELGSGSTFWCKVPFGRAEQRELESQSSALKVLVVDDHAMQREALGALARRLGWQVEAHATGEAALAQVLQRAARGEGFDALIVDAHLPDLNALETLRALAATLDDSFPVPAVVLVTGSDLAPSSAQLADARLSKPVTPAALLDAIGKVVSDQTGRTSVVWRARASGGGLERLPGARVLVVDDGEINREVALRILELEGARVSLASSGEQAMHEVRRGNPRYDLVLMDIQMPGMDGVEATRRIRADQPAGELAIVALTAGALASEMQRAFDAGMDDFISKPFDPEALIATVRRQIERTRKLPVADAPPRRDVRDGPDWPSLDGIDVQDVRRRLGDDRQLFEELLDHLRTAIEAFDGDMASARDELARAAAVHRLRGMAGNLGARALHRAAGELEVALRKGTVEPPVRAHFRRELERLRTALQHRVAPAGPGRPGSGGSSLDLAPLLEQLEKQDLGACSAFREVAPELERRLPRARYAEVDAAVRRLEFTEARSLLRESLGR